MQRDAPPPLEHLRTALAALLLILCCSPAAALAQGAPDPAREAFAVGMAALLGNRFRDAVEALQRSHALRPLPIVLYNLGLAYRGLGRDVDAVAVFERYLREPEPGAPAERLEALRREVARLRERQVTLRLALRPQHATLRVDGRSVLVVNNAAVVDPGPRSVDVTAEGYQPVHRELDLAPGAGVTVEAHLMLLENRARLLVEPSVAEASVFVDQQLVGVGATDVGVAPGRHRVDVRAQGYAPFQRDVWSTGRGVLRISAGLETAGGAGPETRRAGWVLPVAITGGALVVAGAVLGVIWLTRGTESVPQGAWTTFREGGP